MSIEQGSEVGSDPGPEVQPPGGWLADVTDADIEDVTKEAVAKLRARHGPPAADAGDEPEGDEGWSPFVDVLDLAASPAKPPTALAGVVWRGRLSILSGPPKAGKSTVLAQAIGCRLSGEAFAGERVEPSGPVAIVTEEPLELLAQRLRIYGVKPVHPVQVFVASPRHGVDRLVEAVMRSKPEVVLIDSFTPWAVAAGADSLSDPAGMRRVMETLRGIADAGPGVGVVHHARRSDGEMADSRDLAASVDMIVSFDAVDEEYERCLPSSSHLRRLAYLGRWQEDNVVLDYDRSSGRYALREKGGVG